MALPPPLAGAVRALSAERLAAHVAFLASPALAGRALGHPGLEAAGEYVAARLAQAGVAALPPGAGREGYFQTVPLGEVRGLRARLTLEWGRGNRTRRRVFRSGRDAWFVRLPPRALAAPLVDVGFGFCDAETGRDDYRGRIVRGCAVLLRDGLPPDMAATPEQRARYEALDAEERYAARLQAAGDRGAVAVVALETRFRAAPGGPATRTFLAPPGEGRPCGAPPLVRLRPRASAALAAPPGARVVLDWSGREREAGARNLLAWIPGADPDLRDEAVVVGAHLDHLGVVSGRLMPGADDNASGVAALLEMARVVAAAAARPRRSLLFAFWTGEEEGHFGSAHYVRHPAWPLERTVAYVNLDMIGHPWTLAEIRRLAQERGQDPGAEFWGRLDPGRFAEAGVADWAPFLEGPLRQAGRGTGMALRFDRGDGRQGGSDYASFACRRVPWVRFFGNFFPGYHGPGDAAAGVDGGQVQRMTRLALAAIWLLADGEAAGAATRP